MSSGRGASETLATVVMIVVAIVVAVLGGLFFMSYVSSQTSSYPMISISASIRRIQNDLFLVKVMVSNPGDTPLTLQAIEVVGACSASFSRRMTPGEVIEVVFECRGLSTESGYIVTATAWTGYRTIRDMHMVKPT